MSLARRLWSNYLLAINAVVFIVDCAAHDRLGESKIELDVSLSETRSLVTKQGDSSMSCRGYVYHILLPPEHRVLNDTSTVHTIHASYCTIPPQPQALLQNENISNVPFLVLGNKIDRPEAISEGALRGAFGIDSQVTGKVNTSTLLYRMSDCNKGSNCSVPGVLPSSSALLWTTASWKHHYLAGKGSRSLNCQPLHFLQQALDYSKSVHPAGTSFCDQRCVA